jgi:DGQHR domain-containing protein
MSSKKQIIKCPVIRGTVLGVKVYRGYLKLNQLSSISKADIYDSKKNPKGTQRDLSLKHAKEAFEYIKATDLGFWPEVFLCARNKKALTFNPLLESNPDIGILEIDLSQINTEKKISISRVDGNHRLHFGDGKERGYSIIDKDVSFCLAFDLSLDEEIKLFKDINKNQKPMNTSHLDGIDVRLSPGELLKKRNPELYISQKLSDEKKSPFHQRIYDGGKKATGVDIPLRAMKSGIQYMFSHSTQLHRLDNTDAQLKVIINYFNAVKKWLPESWSKPKEYITLRGVGLWAICYLGAQVIDRGLLNGSFDENSFFKILNSGKSWDWSNKGDFKGMSGAQGAKEISSKVARNLKDPNQLSTEELLSKIMKD